eukprot:3993890-Lingulodinium_polyedra.AAC.1
MPDTHICAAFLAIFVEDLAQEYLPQMPGTPVTLIKQWHLTDTQTTVTQIPNLQEINIDTHKLARFLSCGGPRNNTNRQRPASTPGERRRQQCAIFWQRLPVKTTLGGKRNPNTSGASWRPQTPPMPGSHLQRRLPLLPTNPCLQRR